LGVQAARKGGKIEEFTTEAQAKFADFKAVGEKIVSHKKTLIEQVNAGKITAEKALAEEEMKVLVRETLRDASRAVETPIEAIAERAPEQMEVAVEEAATVRSRARNILIGVLVVAVGFALGLGFWIARSITKPVTQLRDASLAMAEGKTDIQLAITSQDELGELGQAFQRMGENIRSLVAEAGMLRDAGMEGKLDTRADASRHQGDYAGIVKGVNDTLDAVIGSENDYERCRLAEALAGVKTHTLITL